mmetsp:Transcript_3822/g.11020  ORF Transcript_3822/g.11020 Transcript_3822/m.11020 type:complete len:364 (-) Transcript_3822:28-1119(-)
MAVAARRDGLVVLGRAPHLHPDLLDRVVVEDVVEVHRPRLLGVQQRRRVGLEPAALGALLVPDGVAAEADEQIPRVRHVHERVPAPRRRQGHLHRLGAHLVQDLDLRRAPDHSGQRHVVALVPVVLRRAGHRRHRGEGPRALRQDVRDVVHLVVDAVAEGWRRGANAGQVVPQGEGYALIDPRYRGLGRLRQAAQPRVRPGLAAGAEGATWAGISPAERGRCLRAPLGTPQGAPPRRAVLGAPSRARRWAPLQRAPPGLGLPRGQPRRRRRGDAIRRGAVEDPPLLHAFHDALCSLDVGVAAEDVVVEGVILGFHGAVPGRRPGLLEEEVRHGALPGRGSVKLAPTRLSQRHDKHRPSPLPKP